ncbi:MAG: pectinesterase family protein [Reichenbachiella sp.]
MIRKFYLSVLGVWLISMSLYGQTAAPYSYSFLDGTIITNGQSDDGNLTLSNGSGSYSHHGGTYGLNMKEGSIISIAVDGSCTLTFLGSEHSKASLSAITTEGEDLGEVLTTVVTDLVDTYEFTYSGEATTITFTSVDGSDIYVPSIEITPTVATEGLLGLIESWDAGAEQLDTDLYINNLTVDVINSWYDESITVGTTGNNLPDFTVGRLSWVGKPTSDRLRSTNEALTRYDDQDKGEELYAGRIYANGTTDGSSNRFFSIELEEDDEVTVIGRSDAAGGVLNFVSETQHDIFENFAESPTAYDFVAKEAGDFKIFETNGKLNIYRILRKEATYQTLTGDIDVTSATGISDAYGIAFTNASGKTWNAEINGAAYTIALPLGYTYDLTLTDANGFIINSANSIALTEDVATLDVVIEKLALFTVTGNVSGLGGKISSLNLVYTPDPSAEKIFLPEPNIDTEAGTYSVELEAGVEYTISAESVNDFDLTTTSISIDAEATSSDIAFTAKPTYAVTIDVAGLSDEEKAKLSLVFANLDEAGYEYSYTSTEGISLRNGTYAISYDGLDEYPVQLALTSNVKIADVAVSKTLAFEAVHNWSFDDKDITTEFYKGLAFTGTISNQAAKGHLTGKAEGTIAIPAMVGQKLIVTYYYEADFSIDGGDAIITGSGSTSTFENVEYMYPGTEDGSITITIGASVGTTYITNIKIEDALTYTETLTVGTDKDFQSINAALDAVSNMTRDINQRVTIMIDPGNYEEMLVITESNVTFKNAAATPDIALANKGVDISDNAVRITSYYGHGYSYYSMSQDQKWHADVLTVNKENGYQSYDNAGSGTTNGSYWNATVVLSGSGFIAEDIIFENSFNQYISQKESEDVVVMWETGSKGERPTDLGNTGVQYKSFVERAAALSITNDVDKVILNNCRVIGRQDSFYGGTGSRVAVYKGSMMGGTDYIFGAMTVVFYQSEFAMNTSEDSNDVSYITAAQQKSGRGYLMYECTVTSAEPGTETASEFKSKPGYFGRPWQGTTSEVVFYNTTIETSNSTGFEDKSLIEPLGWKSTLGGESEFMYEYGTIEVSGEDNQATRESWSTVLSEPVLTDGTDITPYNFTKGEDEWDPFSVLTDDDATLATLSVTEGTISPAFDPEVTEYSVIVPAGTVSITVTATSTSSNATVVIGDFASIPGTDVITVTAGSGDASKVYSINVSVEDPLTIGGFDGADIALYPNPAFGQTTLYLNSISTADVAVYDLSGQVLSYERDVKEQLSLKLNQGIYLVKIFTKEGVATRKIIFE